MQLQSGSVKQLRRLLALPGLDVNVREAASGLTPLMLATSRRQSVLVQALLATGRVDVGMADNGGTTALLMAAQAGDCATMHIECERSGDPGQCAGEC